MQFIRTETETIRLSERRDIPQLKKIWKVCFGDSDEAIDSFFKGAYNENTTLILLHKDTVVSMLSMLPVELNSPVGKTYGYYVYAVATLPEYQGRGYMKLLENECTKFATENGRQFCLLVPATDNLFYMYGKLGYKTFSSVSMVNLTPKQPFSEVKIEKCEFDTFYKLRSEFLSGFSQAVRFELHYEKYAFNEYQKSGGEILFVDVGYICAYKKDKLLTITESSHSKDKLENILSSLLIFTGTESSKMRTQGKDGFSMIKWLEPDSLFAKYKTETKSNFFGFALE